MKTLIHVALLASFAAPLAWSAGTVKVYTPDSEKPKTQHRCDRKAMKYELKSKK